MSWYKSKGVVRYDPARGSMRNRVNWWCVIEADNEIARYYRYWIDKQILNPLGLDGKGLCRPSWGAHISIVRGEQPTPELMHYWKQYDGVEVEFQYSDEVVQTGQNPLKPRPDYYWFVPVECTLARHIRDQFGLYSSYTLHMTIGRTW